MIQESGYYKVGIEEIWSTRTNTVMVISRKLKVQNLMVFAQVIHEINNSEIMRSIFPLILGTYLTYAVHLHYLC